MINQLKSYIFLKYSQSKHTYNLKVAGDYSWYWLYDTFKLKLFIETDQMVINDKNTNL